MPDQPYPLTHNSDHTQVLCELKGEYHLATPEEIVRQQYIHHLHGYYGYAYEQMDQERKTQHGRHSPRADIVVWKSAVDKQANKTPVIVVECKSDNVTIVETDYWQGESYARAAGCELFITHNNKQTRFFKLVPGLPGEWVDIEAIPHADDWGDAKKIAAIKQATRAFNRENDLGQACRLRLKIGIHTGPTIVVTLNDRLDYFGTTVNIASRVSNMAEGEEIILTADTYAAPEVQRLAAPYQRIACSADVRGLDNPVPVYRLRQHESTPEIPL